MYFPLCSEVNSGSFLGPMCFCLQSPWKSYGAYRKTNYIMPERPLQDDTFWILKCVYGTWQILEKQRVLIVHQLRLLNYSRVTRCMKSKHQTVSSFTSIQDLSFCKGRSGIQHKHDNLAWNDFAVFGRWYISPSHI